MDGQAIKDTLGKNIKILRARRGLSQADLAEKADISITFLSNIERGIKFPLPEILSKLANSLGIEVNQLFLTDINSNQDKGLLNQMSEDFTKDVNTAMEKVIKRYLG
jgi:transcriptional regulator with XRE-family HTH domain